MIYEVMNMNKKKAIMVIGAIALFIILYKYLPLLIIGGCVILIIRKDRKQIPEQKPKRPRIEAEPTDYLQIQATVEEAKGVIEEHNNIIRSTDLRQFQGRNNVTKEELATYMFEQHYWNGAYERRTMMEEIIKHCNLTMDDIEWCEENLRHYRYDGDPHEYKACAVYNEEAKAISDYTNEQESARIKQEVAKLIKEHKAQLEFIKPDDTNGELAKIYTEQFNKSLRFYANQLRQYDYDYWLKMKGYIR